MRDLNLCDSEAKIKGFIARIVTQWRVEMVSI